MVDNTTIIAGIIFLVLGISLAVYKKSIAHHLGVNSMFPFRVIFGEKPWIVREERRAERFANVALPLISVGCFIIIALLIASLIW